MAKAKVTAAGPEMTVVPAYGRDYTSAEAVLKDWLAQKDFTITDVSSKDNGRYCNKQDVERYSPVGLTVRVRYARLRNIVFIRDGVIVARVDEDNL